MSPRLYLQVSIINIAILVIGFVVGWIARGTNWTVRAQDGPEYVQPVISAGSALFGTVMSGRVAADQVIIRDVDVVKFMENTVNYLSPKIGTTAGWQGVISDSRVNRPIRVAPPSKAPEGEAKSPQKK